MKNLDFLTSCLIAHRGLHNDLIPENSIESFKKAIKNKNVIELDVHLLKDNTIVVFHDDNTKRMTGKDFILANSNYNDIKNLKLLNTNNKIPKFDEVLRLIDGKVPILIELKTDRKTGCLEREIVKYLDDYNGLFAIQSFNPLTIKWFKKHRPNYIRGLLVNNKYRNIKEYICHKMFLLRISSPDFISCNYNMITNKKINKIKNKYKILAWTIRNKDNYNKYKDFYDNLICESKEVLKWKN